MTSNLARQVLAWFSQEIIHYLENKISAGSDGDPCSRVCAAPIDSSGNLWAHAWGEGGGWVKKLNPLGGSGVPPIIYFTPNRSRVCAR
jgi:hypothetical protein